MPEKQLIVIGGPNGAGKSTFALEYVAEFDYPFFSADAIAKELMPQFPTHAQIAAGREFLRRFTGAVAGSQSLIVESTLSGLSLKRLLQNARETGFSITIVYLFLEAPEMCIARVRERTQSGGPKAIFADGSEELIAIFGTCIDSWRTIGS